MNYDEVRELLEQIKRNVQKVIVGKGDVIDLLLTAIIARGHILLEDVPGTGKTVTARAVARSVDCPFKRIQFTPDLLPSDVTGMSVYNQKEGEFNWKPGPIFAGVVLADEINRATPRTQSSLLECMEERQVTEGGVTRALPEPFLVIATQNPIEIQGTFPLPEAQLDRFLIRMRMGYPSTREAVDILSRFESGDPWASLAPVTNAEGISGAQRAASGIKVGQAVKGYIVALVERTRAMEDILLGASPRATLALMRASQVWALIKGRDYVVPDDVKALAKPVLAHRVILRSALMKSGQADAAIDEAVRMTKVPTEEIET